MTRHGFGTMSQSLKDNLEWKHSDSRVEKFTSNEEIKNTVSDWLKNQSKEFYPEGIQKLVTVGRNVWQFREIT